MKSYRKISLYVAIAMAVMFQVVPTSSSAPTRSTRTNAFWAWPGGEYSVNIIVPRSCSVGFPATDPQGNRYFITAGHCFRSDDGKEHYLSNPSTGKGLEVFKGVDRVWAQGYEKEYFTVQQDGSYFDISLVQMYEQQRMNSGWPHVPNATPNTGSVGDKACLAGYTKDVERCGKILAVSQTVSHRGLGYTRYGLTKTSYCAVAGDAGGAVYNDEGALGIEVDNVYDESAGKCQGYFVPINTVLYNLRLRIPGLRLA